MKCFCCLNRKKTNIEQWAPNENGLILCETHFYSVYDSVSIFIFDLSMRQAPTVRANTHSKWNNACIESWGERSEYALSSCNIQIQMHNFSLASPIWLTFWICVYGFFSSYFIFLVYDVLTFLVKRCTGSDARCLTHTLKQTHRLREENDCAVWNTV